MINVDTLAVVGLIHELAGKTENGAVPLSRVKQSELGKIVYDDSKPEKSEKYSYTAYPVVSEVSGGEGHYVAVSNYDSILKGVTVRYCDYGRMFVNSDGTPAFNNVELIAEDETTGAKVEFDIQDGSFTGYRID